MQTGVKSGVQLRHLSKPRARHLSKPRVRVKLKKYINFLIFKKLSNKFGNPHSLIMINF